MEARGKFLFLFTCKLVLIRVQISWVKECAASVSRIILGQFGFWNYHNFIGAACCSSKKSFGLLQCAVRTAKAELSSLTGSPLASWMVCSMPKSAELSVWGTGSDPLGCWWLPTGIRDDHLLLQGGVSLLQGSQAVCWASCRKLLLICTKMLLWCVLLVNPIVQEVLTRVGKDIWCLITSLPAANS